MTDDVIDKLSLKIAEDFAIQSAIDDVPPGVHDLEAMSVKVSDELANMDPVISAVVSAKVYRHLGQCWPEYQNRYIRFLMRVFRDYDGKAEAA